MEVKFPFYARLAMVLLSIVLIIFLMYVAQSVLIPLFFAVQVALLLYPLTRYLECKLHFSRSLASLVSVVVFVIGLAIFLYILSYQILLFSQDIPTLQARITTVLADLQLWMTTKYHLDSTAQVSYMNQATSNIVSGAAAYVTQLFFQISQIIFWVVIVFIFSYFILHHRRLLVNFVIGIFPKESNQRVQSVITETRAITNNYIIGLLIEFVVVTIAYCATFMLLGIEYAVLLGLICAALNFIPYIGFIVSCILVAIVSLMHGTAALAVQAVGLLFLIHLLDANVLLPRIVGNKVKMNALTTIIAVLMGGILWGIAGMFLSIPISAMLKIIFDNVQTLKPWGLVMGVEDKIVIPKENEQQHG
ncbi:MAG: AI-2E family transporter [Sphingobacteriales bacterium]|nr:MAG: AI-2E family transporter [Sphingobacteriales bacterium]